MDESRVRDVQKRIDRQRRIKEREDAAKAIEEQQKMRAQRATERSNQAWVSDFVFFSFRGVFIKFFFLILSTLDQVLHKRRGRKLIPRSKPRDNVQKKEKVKVEEDEGDCAFFS